MRFLTRERRTRAVGESPSDHRASAEQRQAADAPRLPVWTREWTNELRRVDAEVRPDLSNLPDLLRPVPLAAWGTALLHTREVFPRSGQHLPVMPSGEVQERWTGARGERLLLQSLDFVREVTSWLRLCDIDPAGARGLDFGIGWGRLARLWLKYAPPQALIGADAWQDALDLVADCHLANPLIHTDEVPHAPPARDLDFAWAFSVFTHLDEVAFDACLSSLRGSLRPGGALIFTCLPHAYWARAGARAAHTGERFVHQRDEGRSHYGWTTVSRPWVAERCSSTGLALPGFALSALDPYQLVVLTRRL